MADPKVLWIAVQQSFDNEVARLQSIAALVGVTLPDEPQVKYMNALANILTSTRLRLDHRIQCLDLIEQRLLTLAKNKKKAADSE